jgi:hypothetical protein
VTLTTDDLSRITIDYLFRDREQLIDIALCLTSYGDDEVFKQFVAECDSRGVDVERLMTDADKKHDRIVKLMTSNTPVSGGSKIQVPFIYAVKDKS